MPREAVWRCLKMTEVHFACVWIIKNIYQGGMTHVRISRDTENSLIDMHLK